MHEALIFMAAGIIVSVLFFLAYAFCDFVIYSILLKKEDRSWFKSFW